ncbi:gamma-glutamyltransferase [Kaarinaea lacus]
MPRLVLLLLYLGLAGCQTITPGSQDYQNAIASAHPLATMAGMDVLAEGGNAFDAAITVAAVLAVVEPYSSGIGGGGFWLLHSASDGKRIMLDGRERAPLAASHDMYLDEQGKIVPGLSLNGALAAAIPGHVEALAHLHEHYATLPMQRLLAPAIHYAEQGFVVSDSYRRLATFRLQVLKQSADSNNIFLVNGDIPPKGSVIKQPQLAQTLRKIVQEGRNGFYSGEVAQRLVNGVRSAGGIWSLQDLQQYQVVERQPVTLEWNGMRITIASLPSSGGIVITQILNMLTGQPLSKLDDVQRIHLLVEAMRRAYRERAVYLGDSDYISVNTEELTSVEYAQALMSDFDPADATPSELLTPVPVKPVEGNDTTHYSILDKAGNRVAATLSINYPFGSGYVVPGTGVLLNDEMDDFSIRSGAANAYGLIGNEANAIEPGKRMLSSMSPTFIEGGDRMAIVGTPGGSRIITMLVNAIVAFQQGKSAEEIVALPRFHHQYLPDEIQFEPGALSEEIRSGLELMGHNLKERNSTYGNMQIIVHDDIQSKTTAASDPRGVGVASVR